MRCALRLTGLWCVVIACVIAWPGRSFAEPLRVGSKKFTESVVLGEVLAHTLRARASIDAVHERELGGTRVVFAALERGEIDAYVEYTGTLRQEIYAGESIEPGIEGLAAHLGERGIGLIGPLGFNNTYAIGMLERRAGELDVASIRDLAGHPDLRLRFGNEFMDRADGWPALRAAYDLPHRDVAGLDHDLAYRGLAAGDVDAMDCYSTDAEIAYYGLRVLVDERGHFPRYDAVIVHRADIGEPATTALGHLQGAIDEPAMIAMNARAKLERVPETVVAAEFLSSAQGLDVAAEVDTLFDRLVETTLAHLMLVGIALGAGIVVAVPLGIAAARRRRLGQGILAAVGVLQTVPSLALLVFMIPVLGIGAAPAIAALFVYSLLPIVRNTVTGLSQIPDELLEVSDVLCLRSHARLWRVELPLASPTILAGIKTSAVLCVGTATLGALIGAGGYGQPILTGIRLDDYGLILEGALPAAVLAVLVQGLGELVSRAVVPRGLRLADTRTDAEADDALAAEEDAR